MLVKTRKYVFLKDWDLYAEIRKYIGTGYVSDLKISVADPDCLSRIQDLDPNFSIPDPGS
jgi:hypothetical protein